MSIRRGVEVAGDLIQQNTAVHDIRKGVYQRKAEIVKTPMVREIVHAVIGDFSHPPIHLEIDSNPNMYDFPNVSVNLLSEQLDNGTWATRLILKRKFMGKAVAPRFNIDAIVTIPFEELPIQLDDPKGKGYGKLANVSFWLGIAISLFFVNQKTKKGHQNVFFVLYFDTAKDFLRHACTRYLLHLKNAWGLSHKVRQPSSVT